MWKSTLFTLNDEQAPPGVVSLPSQGGTLLDSLLIYDRNKQDLRKTKCYESIRYGSLAYFWYWLPFLKTVNCIKYYITRSYLTLKLATVITGRWISLVSANFRPNCQSGCIVGNVGAQFWQGRRKKKVARAHKVSKLTPLMSFIYSLLTVANISHSYLLVIPDQVKLKQQATLMV